MSQKNPSLSDRARDFINMGITEDQNDIKPCLRCGESVLPHDLSCQACGDPLPFKMVECRECGMEYKTQAEAAGCPCLEPDFPDDNVLTAGIQRQPNKPMFYWQLPAGEIPDGFEGTEEPRKEATSDNNPCQCGQTHYTGETACLRLTPPQGVNWAGKNDQGHCPCWWECDGCCWCGDDPNVLHGPPNPQPRMTRANSRPLYATPHPEDPRTEASAYMKFFSGKIFLEFNPQLDLGHRLYLSRYAARQLRDSLSIILVTLEEQEGNPASKGAEE